jgi:flagellar basal-body rod modification protein FlgD
MAVSSVSDNPYSFLNTGSSASSTDETEADSGQLAMEDFMTLMTTQLQNQDPLAPMDNGEFLSQIASFGTVSGIEGLQTSFESFASSMQSNQALQGSSLVGRSVLVESSIGNMTAEDGLTGQVNVSDTVTNLKVQIYDEDGVLVKTMDMGPASGYTNFAWDGINDDGEVEDPGVYQFLATGIVDGTTTAFGTATVAKVDSVLVGSGTDGLTMNLAGIGSVPFSDAQEII